MKTPEEIALDVITSHRNEYSGGKWSCSCGYRFGYLGDVGQQASGHRLLVAATLGLQEGHNG